MNISQITVRPSGTTARRILAVVATAAIVNGASTSAAPAAEPDPAWPDHLVERDEGVAATEFVWPDHLVAPDLGGHVAEFVWPDHLVERDGGGRLASTNDVEHHDDTR
jgi:hypothetical protein